MDFSAITPLHIIGMMTAFAAVVGALVAWRKLKPDTAQSIIEAAQKAVTLSSTIQDAMLKKFGEMQDENQATQRENRILLSKIDALEEKIGKLTKAVDKLVEQLKCAGMVPVVCQDANIE